MDAELINVIAIDKDDGDTYVFLYADGCDVLVSETADSMCRDGDLDFDFRDAETVAESVEHCRLERAKYGP